MFTGREYDAETGLYYYRARYYSPTIGRFFQRDPLTWGPDDPRVISSYKYNKETFNVFATLIEKYLHAIRSTGLRTPKFLHPYLYVFNNPLNWVDPFGFSKEEPDEPFLMLRIPTAPLIVIVVTKEGQVILVYPNISTGNNEGYRLWGPSNPVSFPSGPTRNES